MVRIDLNSVILRGALSTKHCILSSRPLPILFNLIFLNIDFEVYFLNLFRRILEMRCWNQNFSYNKSCVIFLDELYFSTVIFLRAYYLEKEFLAA